MTLAQYWSALLKHWILIGTCIVAVGVGAYIGSRLMTRIYESSVLVEIAINSGSGQAYADLLASDQLAQTEAKLAVSNSVLRVVASHYPGLTVNELASEVIATPDQQTQLLEISVDDVSPARAAAIANDVAATFIGQQTQQDQQASAQSQLRVQQDLQQTQQQIDATSGQIDALKAKNGNAAQIATLQSQLNTLQQHYDQMQLLLAQLEVTQSENANLLRVIQPAQPATTPASPNVFRNTGMGLLVGLLLGLLLTGLLEQFDTFARTTEDLARLLGWPVLATVWYQASSRQNQEELVNPPRRSANVEAYRILRTNIDFSLIDKPTHSIMVASAAPRDGKTVIAANLAIFMARAGRNTLLIDADLRRPALREIFHLPPDAMGLSNAIVASSQLQVASATSQIKGMNTPMFSLDPYVHKAGVPNLLVMPAGPLPPNPPELLASKAMKLLSSAISSLGVEVVIFDTPPLLGLSDASILASKVDAAVVVVDATRANKKNLKQLKVQLTQAGTNVLGFVVNKRHRSRKEDAYTYYYYYGEEEKDDTHNRKVPTTPDTPVPADVVPPAPLGQSLNGLFRSEREE